jgi:isopropylmalate/homocitrate/citramalate synthase
MSVLEIVEVGPRDGLQNEDVVLDVAAKVAYIEALTAAGLRRIEAVSFVHPARVPQMADAEAVEAGVTAQDASSGGIGGCPFAPAATGNIATEDLLYALGRSGIGTGIDMARLLTASAYVEERLGHANPALLGRAGMFPALRSSLVRPAKQCRL